MKFFLTCFIFTTFLFPVFIKILQKKKILESPGRRKIHKSSTPSLGGVPIFVGFVLALFLWFPLQGFFEFKYFFGALLLMFILGLRDDLVPLRPMHKLINQIIPALMVIFLFGLQVTNLSGLVGVDTIPYYLGASLTVLGILFITNSFNLIDGIDGLAAVIGLVSILFFGIWFNYVELPLLAILSFTFGGAILAFLFYNWEPSRIFMGDTGALTLGFFISFIAVLFVKHNGLLELGSEYRFNAPISTAICVLIIPLFDSSRVFILRILRGQGPFTPDKSHIHHILVRMGLSHAESVMLLLGFNLVFVAGALLGRDLTENQLLPGVAGVVIALNVLIKIILARKFPGKTRASRDYKKA